MGVQTTAVQGAIIVPSGAPATKGTITIELSKPGMSTDLVSALVHEVGGRIAVPILANGLVSFTLVPNESITPAGTFYMVRFEVWAGDVLASWPELWQIDSAPDPVDIGAITRIQMPGSLAQPPTVLDPLIIPAVLALPSPSLTYWRRAYVLPGGVGTADTWYVCLKGTDDLYHWVEQGGGAFGGGSIGTGIRRKTFSTPARIWEFLQVDHGLSAATVHFRAAWDSPTQPRNPLVGDPHVDASGNVTLSFDTPQTGEMEVEA